MFAKLAATITKNAPSYKTIEACRMIGARLKRAYERAGAYGIDHATYRTALWAIQLRAVELQGIAHDAKWAA